MSTYYGGFLKFPNIQKPSFPIEISYENIVLRSRKENGDYKSRKKFSYSRKTFNLKWNAMSWQDYQILENFYINDCKTNVETFIWKYPAVSSKYQMLSDTFHNRMFPVRFASMAARATEHNSFSVSVVLIQVARAIDPGFAKVGHGLAMSGKKLDVLNVALGTTPSTLEGTMWLQFP